jgi:negative regulator of flagellin synthesis FlgM
MRIDAYNKIAQVYQTNVAKKTTKTSGASATDQVEISRVGKDYQVAKQAVTNSADIRTDKANNIKKQMEIGAYNVSAVEVANKLVDSFFDQVI